MQQDLQREVDLAIKLAREAGRIVLEVYATPFLVEDKPEGAGPVTEADQRANEFIVNGLRQAFPGDGVVAEESANAPLAASARRCWFVDPVDWRLSIVIAVVATFGVWAAITKWLKIQLPAGLLAGVLG